MELDKAIEYGVCDRESLQQAVEEALLEERERRNKEAEKALAEAEKAQKEFWAGWYARTVFERWEDAWGKF